MTNMPSINNSYLILYRPTLLVRWKIWFTWHHKLPPWATACNKCRTLLQHPWLLQPRLTTREWISTPKKRCSQKKILPQKRCRTGFSFGISPKTKIGQGEFLRNMACNFLDTEQLLLSGEHIFQGNFVLLHFFFARECHKLDLLWVCVVHLLL